MRRRVAVIERLRLHGVICKGKKRFRERAVVGDNFVQTRRTIEMHGSLSGMLISARKV